MSREVVVAALFAISVISETTFLHAQEVPEIEKAGRAAVADGATWHDDVRALTTLVRKRWSYLELKAEHCGVDLDKLESRALSALGDHPDRVALLRALTGYAAGLRDGHAHVTLAGASLQGPRRWPVFLAEAEEGIFLLGTTREDREAERLLPGDVLHAVDGVPVDRAIGEAEHLICASTPGARRARAIRRLFLSTDATRVRLTLRRGEDASFEIEVPCLPADAVVAAPVRLWFQPEVRWAAPRVAYWRPGHFNSPEGFREADPEARELLLADTYRAYEKIMDDFAGAQAIVLDLRGNPGGTDSLGQHLARLLLPPGKTYFQLQARTAKRGWFRRSRWGSWHRHVLTSIPEREPFAGPLAVLIDHGTFSTADNLAACLRDEHPDVTFIGRPTGAGTGAPRRVTLPASGATVSFCTMRVKSPSGAWIEGVGVTPDVPVLWTIADHLEGKDPDLAAALKQLAPAEGR